MILMRCESCRRLLDRAEVDVVRFTDTAFRVCNDCVEAAPATAAASSADTYARGEAE